MNILYVLSGNTYASVHGLDWQHKMIFSPLTFKLPKEKYKAVFLFLKEKSSGITSFFHKASC